MGRPSKRSELLDAGVDVFHRRGYAATSIESITEAARVPKGALLNHFGSKEAFAKEALRRYFERQRDLIAPIVADPTIGAIKKLQALLASMRDEAERTSCSFGCLIGNFAAELSSQHDDIRLTISELFRNWVAPFEIVIAEGQKAGELSSVLQPAQGARFIVNGLQGAFLRSKVDRDPSPFVDLDEIVFGVLLAPAEVDNHSKRARRRARVR